MSKEIDIERINYLQKIILKYQEEYHTQDNPTISDYEYDTLINELIALEEKYPQYKTKDSPTNKVGAGIKKEFEKIEHKRRMMSLSNAYDDTDLRNFDRKIKEIVNLDNIEYVGELKIDGLAISLVYKDGKLVYAATRGNGVIGENVTQNIKTIKSIPQTIDIKAEIEVRGEIYMPISEFNKINEERKKNDQELLANPRNSAAGSIRQLDSKITKERKLEGFFYYLVNAEDLNVYDHYESLNKLKELGFVTNNQSKKLKNIDEAIKYIEEISKIKNDLNYQTDGIVFKVNNIRLHEKIGYVSKSPKWAIAYKFPPEEVETKLENIIFTVGRTGKIIPNAVLTPVKIAGTTVSKATLHNEDFILNKDLRINDIVIVRKAGEIIPEIVGNKAEKRDSKTSIPFKMIESCPSCGEKIHRSENESAYYCNNKNCPSKAVASLIHFVSRKAMNIEGLGERILNELFELNLLEDISSIYELKEKKDDLVNLPGFGEQSITNLLEAIEKSKNNSLEFLLFGLGIKDIGEKSAKILSQKFLNIDNIMQTNFEQLTNIKDIGTVSAQNICDYFSNEQNIKLIQKLKDLNLNFSYTSSKQTDFKETIFKNKNVVITGTFSTYKRDELKQILEGLQANILSAVSAKTDFLLCGEDAGSKLDKAQQLNVKVIFEDELSTILTSKNT